MVRIFYSSDTSSEARQMNRRQILLINLLNRRQRFDSDARRLTLKDTDHCFQMMTKLPNRTLCDWRRRSPAVVPDDLREQTTQATPTQRNYGVICRVSFSPIINLPDWNSNCYFPNDLLVLICFHEEVQLCYLNLYLKT